MCLMCVGRGVFSAADDGECVFAVCVRMAGTREVALASHLPI